MKPDLSDVLLLTGLAGIGGGVYIEFGTGWALIVVSTILLGISILGEFKS